VSNTADDSSTALADGCACGPQAALAEQQALVSSLQTELAQLKAAREMDRTKAAAER